MLTKNDLQQIGKVIDDRLGSKLDEKLNPIKTTLGLVQKDLKDVKKRVGKIEKTVDVMAKLFDAEDVRLGKRVATIEKHLDLTSKN
jgi:hypothetical protein